MPNESIYKSAKISLVNKQATLELGAEFKNVDLITEQKNINSLFSIYDNCIILIAALWSGADRMSIKLTLQASEFYPNQNFKIKGYDKADEIKDFLYPGYSTKELFSPTYLFIQSGKLLIKESGKIYNMESLREKIKEIFK